MSLKQKKVTHSQLLQVGYRNQIVRIKYQSNITNAAQ